MALIHLLHDLHVRPEHPTVVLSGGIGVAAPLVCLRLPPHAGLGGTEPNDDGGLDGKDTNCVLHGDNLVVVLTDGCTSVVGPGKLGWVKPEGVALVAVRLEEVAGAVVVPAVLLILDIAFLVIDALAVVLGGVFVGAVGVGIGIGILGIPVAVVIVVHVVGGYSVVADGRGGVIVVLEPTAAAGERTRPRFRSALRGDGGKMPLRNCDCERHVKRAVVSTLDLPDVQRCCSISLLQTINSFVGYFWKVVVISCP